MSVSIVEFMIIDQIAQFKYLPQSVDIYNGIAQHECQGILIYGGYNNLGKGVDLVHTFNLPTHLKVRITATILLEDSSDKEVLQFSVDGNVVQEFTNDAHEGFDGCGNSEFQEKWFDLLWEGDHIDNTLVVKFVNNLNEPTSNESWGQIDFKAFILSECYYLYTECDYQGIEYIFAKRLPNKIRKNLYNQQNHFEFLKEVYFYFKIQDFKEEYYNIMQLIRIFPKKIYISEPRK